jgi:hypothetical protein
VPRFALWEQKGRDAVSVRYVPPASPFSSMNRNALYLIIGALIVAAGVLGYQLYQERQKPGFSISVGGKEGLKIEGQGK